MIRRGALGALVTALLAWALVACGGSGGGATAASVTTSRVGGTVPPGFLGIVSEDGFAAQGAARRKILATQRKTGVQLIRQTFDWSTIERRRGRYDFSAYDAYVADVAGAGLDLMPIVFRAPPFDTAKPPRGVQITATTTCEPRTNASYARFARALVQRYGPAGSFWKTHPAVPFRPVRSWQVWNEPNLPQYWCGKPNAAQYAALLKAAHTAIRSVDPTATVVTGGIPDSRLGIPLQRYVQQLYAAGARGTFEALAIHPYAVTTAGVLAAVRAARRIVDARGDRAVSLWATEFGWSSGGPKSSFTVGPARQAKLVLDTLTSLYAQRKALGLRGAIYFDWRDAPPYAGKGDFWGLHTGLLNKNGVGKPALSAYYQAAGVIGTLP